MKEEELPGIALGAPAEEASGPRPAGFNERFIAYVLDALPFVLAAYWTMARMIESGRLDGGAGSQFLWKLLWIALYLVYETVLSSGGRATLGKLIMGIRVRARDGGELSVFRAFLRSAGYFLSAAPLNLGYAAALFTPEKRALHDYVGGSRVISVRERGDLAQGFVLAVSWALMVFFAVTWLNQTVLSMSPSEKRMVAQARRGVGAVAKLQAMHLHHYGSYTDDIRRLAKLSGDVDRFRRELTECIDPESLAIATDGRQFMITARARNWRRTEVRVSSPDRK